MKSYQKKMIGKSMDRQKQNLAENLDRNDRMYNYNRKMNFGDFMRVVLGIVMMGLIFFGSYFLVFEAGSGPFLLVVLGVIGVFDLFLLLINKAIKSTFLRYLFFVFHPGFFFLVNLAFIGFMYSRLGAYVYYYFFFIMIGLFLLFVPYLMSVEKCEAALEAIKMQPEGHEMMTGEEELNATTKQKSYKWVIYPIFVSWAFPMTRWFGFLALFVYGMLYVAFQMRITSKKFKDQKKGLVPMDDFVALEAEMKAAALQKLNEAAESEELEELSGLEESDSLDGLESLGE